MVEMFSVAAVFYFLKFCLGLLISAPTSVSADLGKPMANLKTTLVHIPLRIETFKEPGCPCLLSLRRKSLLFIIIRGAEAAAKSPNSKRHDKYGSLILSGMVV